MKLELDNKPTMPLGTAEQDKPKNEPIMQFESQEQLNASLKEWQGRLGLRDWIIKAVLVDVFANNVGASGHCFANFVAKTSTIRILQHSLSESGTDYIKFCSEQSLVHELLHCVLFGAILEDEHAGTDWAFYKMRTHQELETLSRAFICTKYNITLDWFRTED